jgi:hypothetical protein
MMGLDGIAAERRRVLTALPVMRSMPEGIFLGDTLNALKGRGTIVLSYNYGTNRWVLLWISGRIAGDAISGIGPTPEEAARDLVANANKKWGGE